MTFYTGRPNIPDINMFLAEARRVLASKRLTNRGVLVKELETRLSEYLGVNHVITVCNATVGLMTVIKLLGLTGEVILPSFTFIASAHVLKWEGIKPVFCDIDPLTHNIDHAQVESLITDSTTAIMGVHIWGRSCPHEELYAIAKKHGLRLFYDAAHAFGTSYKMRAIAALEEISVLSFHATKVFNTFEGGAIVTNDDELARKARLMSNYSFEGEDCISGLGINAKMSEIHAAMGLCSLDNHHNVLEHNKNVYMHYRDKLAELNSVSIINYSESEQNNFHYVIIEIDEETYGKSRDSVHKGLKANGVMTKRYFYPGCHNSEPYRSLYPGVFLPNTEALCKRVLALPGGSGIDNLEQVSQIVSYLIAEKR